MLRCISGNPENDGFEAPFHAGMSLPEVLKKGVIPLRILGHNGRRQGSEYGGRRLRGRQCQRDGLCRDQLGWCRSGAPAQTSKL